MTEFRFAPTMQSKPIREIAYEALKHAILTGQIPAGARIVETEYADRLHISRTPLREALRKLERDGLVEYVLRRGVVVRAFSLADVDEIYTMRNALEMLTLPALIERVTDADVAALRERVRAMETPARENDTEILAPLARQFHMDLIRISGKFRILRVIEGQDEYVARFSAASIAVAERRMQAHAEHGEIVDRVAARDLPGLRALMLRHIEESKANCLKALIARKQLPEVEDDLP